jgi:hypothetical protein
MASDNDAPETEPARQRGRLNPAQAQAARQKAEFILSRAYGLLVKPDAEWAQIRDERTTPAAILMGYVAPLAAIPPAFGFVGQTLFGERIGGQVVRVDLGQALTSGVIAFALSVALIYFLGVLINALADQFEADKDDLAALKVSAYAATPAFLSGIFALWPPIWWIGLIGMGLSAWLLLRGLPPLMKTPPDRAMGYAATVTIAALIALVVMFMLSSCITGVGRL